LLLLPFFALASVLIPCVFSSFIIISEFLLLSASYKLLEVYLVAFSI
jgi:hypothetical protein